MLSRWQISLVQTRRTATTRLHQGCAGERCITVRPQRQQIRTPRRGQAITASALLKRPAADFRQRQENLQEDAPSAHSASGQWLRGARIAGQFSCPGQEKHLHLPPRPVEALRRPCLSASPRRDWMHPGKSRIPRSQRCADCGKCQTACPTVAGRSSCCDVRRAHDGGYGSPGAG